MRHIIDMTGGRGIYSSIFHIQCPQVIEIQRSKWVSKPRKNALAQTRLPKLGSPMSKDISSIDSRSPIKEPEPPETEKKERALWFAMRATYRREAAACKWLDGEEIRYFVPMRYEERIVKGKKIRSKVPVVHNLMFVYATPDKIKEVKAKIEYLQYITDLRNGEKIIVPEDQMQRFIAVAGTYNDQLLWFKPEELNLSKGTRVRITGGEFEGLEGVFVKVKGARDRRVVIAIQGVIAIAMATLHPTLIEVLPKEKKNGDKPSLTSRIP